ncbi:hypothetical protein CRM22_007631 [Opisthorchis felineus]|uniref:Uncharacterized protein n=1 Tax=Opisthorchis felineus TaxID=147828 RepID=A0A4V3SDU8_OPIFE|nr:hypothetical protein CRM22_007631 [Opisthorchis felineus]
MKKKKLQSRNPSVGGCGGVAGNFSETDGDMITKEGFDVGLEGDDLSGSGEDSQHYLDANATHREASPPFYRHASHSDGDNDDIQFTDSRGKEQSKDESMKKLDMIRFAEGKMLLNSMLPQSPSKSVPLSCALHGLGRVSPELGRRLSQTERFIGDTEITASLLQNKNLDFMNQMLRSCVAQSEERQNLQENQSISQRGTPDDQWSKQHLIESSTQPSTATQIQMCQHIDNSEKTCAALTSTPGWQNTVVNATLRDPGIFKSSYPHPNLNSLPHSISHLKDSEYSSNTFESVAAQKLFSGSVPTSITICQPPLSAYVSNSVITESSVDSNRFHSPNSGLLGISQDAFLRQCLSFDGELGVTDRTEPNEVKSLVDSDSSERQKYSVSQVFDPAANFSQNRCSIAQRFPFVDISAFGIKHYTHEGSYPYPTTFESYVTPVVAPQLAEHDTVYGRPFSLEDPSNTSVSTHCVDPYIQAGEKRNYKSAQLFNENSVCAISGATTYLNSNCRTTSVSANSCSQIFGGDSTSSPDCVLPSSVHFQSNHFRPGFGTDPDNDYPAFYNTYAASKPLCGSTTFPHFTHSVPGPMVDLFASPGNQSFIPHSTSTIPFQLFAKQNSVDLPS